MEKVPTWLSAPRLSESVWAGKVAEQGFSEGAVTT